MKQQVNLYLALPKRQPIKLPFSLMAKIWIGLLVLALAIYGFEGWAFLKEKNHLAEVQARNTSAVGNMAAIAKDLPDASKMNDIKKHNQDLQQTLTVKQQLAGLLKNNTLNTHGFSIIFDAIAHSIPSSVWLQGITISDNGKLLRLRGKSYQAEAITDFSNNLHNNDVFKGWRFQLDQVSTDTQETTSTLDFVLEAKYETTPVPLATS